MTKSTLIDHYNRKYSHEGSGSPIELIENTRIPTSRFEAAAFFIPRYFSHGNILEIGAGNGLVAKTLLASNNDIKSYTLGDISSARLKGLKRNMNDPRVEILQLDADDISATVREHYDVVIMIALIEHLIDPMRAMSEIRKILKPGGFAFVQTPNVAKYTRRIKLLMGRFPSTASTNEGLTTYSGQPADLFDEGHLHYFTYRSLTRMLLDRCGFSKVIRLPYSSGKNLFGKHIHYGLGRVCPGLFADIAVIAYA